jgi:prevent-host-death family protein
MKKSGERTVKVAELKARLSEYLRNARQGRSATVCDRETPIARLVPSTAVTWRDAHNTALTLATHDKALALAARSVGLQVVGV